MTEKEVDVVAEELARIGGSSWYPGRNEDPVLRVVTERYRERARAAIAALDRYRAGAAGNETTVMSAGDPIALSPDSSAEDRLRIGTTVIYRPPGDRRAYSCVVDQVGEGRIHLIPQMPGGDGWVCEAGIVTEDVVRNLEDEGVTASKALRGFLGNFETERPEGRSR